MKVSTRRIRVRIVRSMRWNQQTIYFGKVVA